MGEINNLYKLFTIKKNTFYGTKKDKLEYQSNNGNSIIFEQNINNLIESFYYYCEKNKFTKQYLIHGVNKDTTITLLWNIKNVNKLYLMFYNNNKDNRMYSVNINDIPNLYNEEKFNKIIKSLPNMCKFSQTILERQLSKNIWMLDDLQKFADNIDKYDNLEY